MISFIANYESFRDVGRFHHGRKNLELLIQAEDRYYQKTGEYLPLDPFSDTFDAKKKLGWNPGWFTHTCEYGVSVSGVAFTAVVRYRLGDGTFNYRNEPVNVQSFSSGVTSIYSGQDHNCALTSKGTKCWGSDINGQLGDGSYISKSTPVGVIGLNANALALSSGGSHTCALIGNGTIKCWGDNSYGQLGNGNFQDSLLPVDVIGLSSGVTKISTGEFHTCVLLTGGGIKCWGNNSSCQLGDNTNLNRNTPVEYNVLDLSSGYASLSSGDNYTCSLTETGEIKCWGGDYGCTPSTIKGTGLQ
jgi:alpha-tubulin suppressor-like RCC1 family protein